MILLIVPLYVLVALCFVLCGVIMSIVWLWAKRLRNAGVVDIFWAFNFVVIAVVLSLLAPAWLPRRVLIGAMLLLAEGRLCLHLAVRVLGHLHEEDGRYKQLRQEWAPRADRKFFWFFQAQALSNLILAIPFFIVTQNVRDGFSGFEVAGAALWVIAFLGEAVADAQLAAFKRNPANKGKVCSTGLWNYSRHPNYFFEWVMWMAYFIFALGSSYGWLAILSPLIILYLLLKVTGIPATEEQSLRSKGAAYENYQRQTSVFIPWFKKK